MALRSSSPDNPTASPASDPELVKWAHELDIDPCGRSNGELLMLIKEIQNRLWELHGTEVMRAYNEMIARDGRPLDGWPND